MRARTLPVTPAERFLATCLQAHQAWNTDDAPQSSLDPAALDVAHALAKHGMLTLAGYATPAGATLLARVEAAAVLTAEQVETLTDMIEDLKSPASEGWTLPSGQNAIIKAPGGHLSIVHTSSLQRWAGKLQELLSAAGATPLDAPSAKEPR